MTNLMESDLFPPESLTWMQTSTIAFVSQALRSVKQKQLETSAGNKKLSNLSNLRNFRGCLWTTSVELLWKLQNAFNSNSAVDSSSRKSCVYWTNGNTILPTAATLNLSDFVFAFQDDSWAYFTLYNSNCVVYLKFLLGF